MTDEPIPQEETAEVLLIDRAQPEVLDAPALTRPSPWVAEVLAFGPSDHRWREIALRSLDTPESGELIPMTAGALRVVFDELAQQWREETKGSPLPARRETHFAYQQIIGMGEAAVPMILESLADEIDDWFWALVAITRFDVAEGVSDVDEAADRWLKWGRETGRLTVHTIVRP